VEGVVWRHPLDKVEVWKLMEAKLNSSPPKLEIRCRFIARVIGIVVWHSYLALEQLLRMKSTLLLASRLGAFVPTTKKGWDASMTLTPDEHREMRLAFKRVCENDWIVFPAPKRRLRIYLAADSSKRRYGYLVWNNRRIPINIGAGSGLWAADAPACADARIFVKELLTVVLAVERIVKLDEFAGISLEIFCIEDNTAVAQVIERGWSTTKVGLELLERLARTLANHHDSTIQMITVRSQDNPADQPSRNQPVRPARVACMWNIIDLFEAGRVHRSQASDGSYNRKRKATTTDLRHEEAEVEEEDWVESSDDESPNPADDDTKLLEVMYGDCSENCGEESF
jgi:hypothetical protein